MSNRLIGRLRMIIACRVDELESAAAATSAAPAGGGERKAPGSHLRSGSRVEVTIRDQAEIARSCEVRRARRDGRRHKAVELASKRRAELESVTES